MCIKYEVKVDDTGYGTFYARIVGSNTERARFNDAAIAHFMEKIRRRYLAANVSDTRYSIHTEDDKRTIKCEYIPYVQGYFWRKIRYMIAIFNGMSWNDSGKKLCVDCGDLWKHWGTRCLGCADIITNNPGVPDIATEFNNLIEEAFS